MNSLPHIPVPTHGYWLGHDKVKLVEENYSAKYMGYWCIKDKDGAWTNEPVDVFYQPNPDKSKGHSNYFGIYIREMKDWNGDNMSRAYIVNAESAFSEPMQGVLCEDGEVLVSRFRHDFVIKENHFIDGGRDYTKRSSGSPLVEISVNGGDFVLKWNPPNLSEQKDVESN